MIDDKTKIYVVGLGFIKTRFVSPGDRVYTLDSELNVSLDRVTSISSEFVYSKLNIIDAGQQNIDTTDDTRFLYHSDKYGSKYIKFSEIPSHTPNKEFSETKYLPVLTAPFWAGKRNHSNPELEYIARMIAIEDYDIASFSSILGSCTGEDAMALIDMLEFWVSGHPGKGWFGRVQVKARMHVINNLYIAEEICRLACLAGYTARLTNLVENKAWAVMVSYESRPVPGSRPKNEKYFQTLYFGNVYNLNAGNKNILGCSKDRYFYLNTVSTLNKEN